MQRYSKWLLVVYDAVVLLLVQFFFALLAGFSTCVPAQAHVQAILSLCTVLPMRFLFRIYRQMWRYGGMQSYIRLFLADAAAVLLNAALSCLVNSQFSLVQLFAAASMNLLGAMTMRICYRYCYQCWEQPTRMGRLARWLLRIFSGRKQPHKVAGTPDRRKINVAIIGAGRVGAALAMELINADSLYRPCCFVDIDESKAGRQVHDLPVLPDGPRLMEMLQALHVQEVVFAIGSLREEKKPALYERYRAAGYHVKAYDYAFLQAADNRRVLREFEMEDLLFRKNKPILSNRTREYYRDKTILVTGGGGSIGSELCRQLARFAPRQIIALDIYENGVYNVQQDIRTVMKLDVDIRVEIASITNRRAMQRVFARYQPDIVINAAAHKHVPLMENNCIEAVENNVFGTEVLIELSEKYRVQRFMMLSTDKAVNPTNVMGATKRMCEMLVQHAATQGSVQYCATRFGNVLGSAGSVIPLFKKQIAMGGPLTLTDKRIVRYFMTIPEAAQLVLTCGAMANNGELFVLDMGQPVKILDLAQSMIRLSGVQGIDIVETGLRPGEKLYEELLVKTEELDKTDNDLIFIERDAPLASDALQQKMQLLRDACQSECDERVRAALHTVVPTYKTPAEINAEPHVGMA